MRLKMIRVFLSVFFRCYIILILTMTIGVIFIRIYLGFRYLGWEAFSPFSSLELKLIFIPMFFVSIVLAFLAAMAHKRNY